MEQSTGAPSPKVTLINYLAGHKDGTPPSMPERGEAFNILKELCREKVKKELIELTPAEQEEFYNWCAKGTPHEAEIKEQLKALNAA